MSPRLSALCLVNSARTRSCRFWSRRTLVTYAPDASEAAAQLMCKFRDQIAIRKQRLDGLQLQRLCLTLGRSTVVPGLDVTSEPPPDGTPVPAGYHLVYFTPAHLETSLGPDGTDQTYNAPAPFSRRMWAGGRMTWEKGSPLRVGDMVEERTTLCGATPKRSRTSGEMVLVDVRKEFWTERGLSLVDQRSWIFRPPPVQGQRGSPSPDHQHDRLNIYGSSRCRDVASGAPAASEPGKKQPLRGHSQLTQPQGQDVVVPSRHLTWSPVALFRFSALTFNAHMIHYNETWTRTVERHPGLVVHGPLNLINMLDYWRDHRAGGEEQCPTTISYKAVAPIYAAESYTIRTVSGRLDETQPTELCIDKGNVVCMTGTMGCH